MSKNDDIDAVKRHEERFTKWIQTIKLFFESPELNSENVTPFTNILMQVITSEKATTENVMQNYQKFHTVMEELFWSTEDMKHRLSRLVLPRIYNEFCELLNKINSPADNQQNLQSSLLTSGFTADCIISSMDSDKESAILNFFQTISHPSSDALLGVCSFADFLFRMHKSTNYSLRYLDALVSHEKEEQKKALDTLTARVDTLNDLKSQDGSGIITSTTEKLRNEVSSLQIDLNKAHEEEEIARKAYEAAMQRTKAIQTKVSNVSNVVNLITNQATNLSKISDAQITYSTAKHERTDARMKVYDSLIHHINSVWPSSIGVAINNQLPELISSMLHGVQLRDTDSKSAAENLSFRRRLVQEILCLWKRLQRLVVSPIPNCVLEGSLDFNLQAGDNFVRPNDQDIINSAYSSSTVVLYFTTVCHDTPEDHVESQSRISTSIQQLRKRIIDEIHESNFPTSHKSAEETTRKRKLILKICDSVVSPPLWSLPLVHSLQYLTRLWNCAQEAAEEDLFVPLEFDTEWETDDEFSSDSDVEGSNRLRRQSVLQQMDLLNALDEDIIQRVGKENITRVNSMLRPSSRDFRIAAEFNNQGFGGMDNKVPGIGKIRTSRRSLNTSESTTTRRRRGSQNTTSNPRFVKTPYGPGELMDDMSSTQIDEIVCVKLQWGAIGYLNRDTVEFPAQQTTQQRLFESIEVPPNVTNSAVATYIATKRFRSTDLVIHKLVRRILNQVKQMTLILERIDIKDAHMSLWLHGRTGPGASQSIESKIYQWLQNYDRLKLEETLSIREATEAHKNEDSAETFMNTLNELTLPHPVKYDPSFDIDGKYSDYNALLLEAIEYSITKTTEKYNRIPGKPRKKKHGTGTKFSPPAVAPGAHNLLANAMDEAQFTTTGNKLEKVHIGNRGAKLHSVPPDLFRSKEEERFNDLIHRLFANLLKTMNLTQNLVANDLARKFQYKTNQTTLSAWMRYKASSSHTVNINFFITKWIEYYRKFLDSTDAALLDEVLSLRDLLGTQNYNAKEDNQDQDQEEASMEINSESEDDEEKLQSIASSSPRKGQMPVSSEHALLDADLPLDLIQLAGSSAALVHESAEMNTDYSGVSFEQTMREAMELSLSRSHYKDDSRNATAAESKSLSNDEESIGSIQSIETDELQKDDELESAVEDEEADEEADEEGGEDAQDEDEDANDRADLLTMEPPPASASFEEQNDAAAEVGGEADGKETSVQELHQQFVAELQRRKVSQIYASKEMARLGYSLKQQFISKFIKTERLPFVRRAQEFTNCIQAWLKYSKDASRDNSAQSAGTLCCSNCGKSSSLFTTSAKFYQHVSKCSINDKKQPGRGGSGADNSHAAPKKREFRRRSLESAIAIESASDSEGDDNEVAAIEEDYEAALQKGFMQIYESELPVDDQKSVCVLCNKPAADISGEEQAVSPAPSVPSACVSCHAYLHTSCIEGAGLHSIPTSGQERSPVCPACYASGAYSTKSVPMRSRYEYCVERALLYCYYVPSKAWIKAIVEKTHSNLASTVLLRWISSDPSLDGERQWVQYMNVSLKYAQLEPMIPTSWSSEGGGLINRKRSKSKKYADNFEMRGRIYDVGGRRGGRGRGRERAGRGGTGRGERGAARGSFTTHRKRRNSSDDIPPAGGASTGASNNFNGEGMSDTYIGANSLKAALCTAGNACHGVDIVMCSVDSNVFVCSRPPGHHAGRNGCTPGCLSTGFCLLNNAAIALVYARVRWGLVKVAVVDIDIHFGNGTADILRGDSNAFFASVHMIYGDENNGTGQHSMGFYPAALGGFEITDNYVSVGVQPETRRRGPQSSAANPETTTSSYSAANHAANDSDSDSIKSLDIKEECKPSSDVLMDVDSLNASVKQEEEVSDKARADGSQRGFRGAKGFKAALQEVIIPRLEAFQPELLIISAGFDGYVSDPLGSQLKLSLEDYVSYTRLLMKAMERVALVTGDHKRASRVVSLLEGGYDTKPLSLGLAKCVDVHVDALRQKE